MARDLPNPLPALAEIRRWTFAPAPMQATVRQAMDIMRTNTAEAVCIDERSPNTVSYTHLTLPTKRIV